MKIIQTFWSAPSRLNEKTAIGGRNSGGWLNERYHAMGWALSCLNFRRFYPDISLYTDTEGADWLCNDLQLPYKYVSTELDRLAGYNPLLWAMAKVYAYGQQSEPFLHVDGDVFIWKPFDRAVERSGLVAQNYETHTEFYRQIMDQVESTFDHIPEELKGINVPGQPIRCINAGILGGHNIEFFRSYAEAAFRFVEENSAHLDKIDLGMFNPVAEQLLFLHHARAQELPIHVAFEEEGIGYQRLMQASTVPLLNTFIHTVAGAKRNPIICLELEARLKYEHPKMYRHINDKYGEGRSITLTFAIEGKKPLHLPEGPSLAASVARQIISAGEHDWTAWMEEAASAEELNEEEALALDLYAVEEAAQSLRQQAGWNRPATEVLFEDIQQGLPALYAVDAESFLHRSFVLNDDYRVLVLNRVFDEELTPAYLQSLLSATAAARKAAPGLMLVEAHDAQLLYSYLEGWEALLLYFEGEPMTGLQLLELLRSGDTPFAVRPEEAVENVFHFLVNECYVQKRLRLADPQSGT